MSAHVLGVCPACGRTSLVYRLPEGGYPFGRLDCEYASCPEPNAAHTLLGETEVQHLVTIKEGHWTIRHPLIERIDDRLMRCGLASWLTETLDLTEFQGLYRATTDGDVWYLEPVTPVIRTEPFDA